jgi:cytochrome c oxidase subunit 4
MTEQTKALHAEAVETLRRAEAKIDAILERSEVKSALEIVQSDEADGAKATAKRLIAEAHDEARVIAQDAIETINALMDEAGDPAEAQRLTAIIHAALDDPRPGVRFSEHVDDVGDGEIGHVEAAALRFEGALNAVMLPFLDQFERGLAGLEEPGEARAQAFEHALHSDTVDLFGREITVMGGLYTVVFGVLAIVTIVEVILAESPMPNVIAYPVLSALSIGKAVLVVLYYMHLREDSRIFVWSFGLPLAMAAMIIIFLLLVNPVTY